MPPIDICRKFLLLQQKISGKLVDKVEESSTVMRSIDNGLSKFKGDDTTP
jgi:hypothetical protein